MRIALPVYFKVKFILWNFTQSRLILFNNQCPSPTRIVAKTELDVRLTQILLNRNTMK